MQFYSLNCSWNRHCCIYYWLRKSMSLFHWQLQRKFQLHWLSESNILRHMLSETTEFWFMFSRFNRNGIPASDSYSECDPSFRYLSRTGSRLIPPISPGFHRDPDGIPFSFSLGYRILIFHPILMRFLLLNELCWELLMICQQISSLFYGFWEKLDRKRP